MSASESELSSAVDIPADATIEQCLKRIARALAKDENVTVNQVRSRAETELGLEVGFLKSNADWKERSKSLVTKAIEEDEDEEDEDEEAVSKAPKPSAKRASKPAPKPAAKPSKKRKSDEEDRAPPKRRKKQVSSESDEALSNPPSDEEDEVSDVKPAKKPVKRAAKTSAKTATKARSSAKVESEDEDEDEVGDISAPKDVVEVEDADEGKDEEDHNKPTTQSNGNANTVDAGDESDLSSLIDDPPPKKKRQKKDPASKSKPTTTKAKQPKFKPAGKELSPDDEEIKRLQGWLVRCGIRKRWHLELAKCDTSKAKIKHLKGMLDDAGMTGRYSNEKAKQIKESRELAEEIEAAQEFNKHWGQSEDDDDEKDERDGRQRRASKANKEEEEDEDEEREAGPPKRRLPKGFIDFGDSGDDGSD